MKGSALVLLVIALGLGACSSESSYESVESIAVRLSEEGFRCDETTPLPEATLVKDSATCGTGDSKLEIYTFASDSKMNDWLKVGRGLNGVITGKDWAVVAGAQAEAVREALGGKAL